MYLTYESLSGVRPVTMISATATYGIGLLTAISMAFCNLLGVECELYNQKIEKAKVSATGKLVAKAQAANATGIMSIGYQIHGTTVFMYGVAYAPYPQQ